MPGNAIGILLYGILSIALLSYGIQSIGILSHGILSTGTCLRRSVRSSFLVKLKLFRFLLPFFCGAWRLAAVQCTCKERCSYQVLSCVCVCVCEVIACELFCIIKHVCEYVYAYIYTCTCVCICVYEQSTMNSRFIGSTTAIAKWGH